MELLCALGSRYVQSYSEEGWEGQRTKKEKGQREPDGSGEMLVSRLSLIHSCVFEISHSVYNLESTQCILKWNELYTPKCIMITYCYILPGIPGGSDGKEPARSATDPGSFSGSGRSPGGGLGNPCQHSCLKNPMDSQAWWATVHVVAQCLT